MQFCFGVTRWSCGWRKWRRRTGAGNETVICYRQILYLVSGLVALKKNKKKTPFSIFRLMEPHIMQQINHLTSQLTWWSLSSALAHLSPAEVCGKPAVLLPSGTSERTSGWRSHCGCSVCTSSGLPADPASFGSRECLGAQQPHRWEQYRGRVNLKRILRILITSVTSASYLGFVAGGQTTVRVLTRPLTLLNLSADRSG